MINGAYYAGELRWLRQEIARKRRGKLSRGVLFLQNNAPAHTSQVAMTAATECGFEIFPHPPYFLDMAPSDFLALVCGVFCEIVTFPLVSWVRCGT